MKRIEREGGERERERKEAGVSVLTDVVSSSRRPRGADEAEATSGGGGGGSGEEGRRQPGASDRGRR